ncbi:Bystin-domain-containing protein [Tuber magnatum]|uniref:Bystin-domain-containing protein n=1 Tax=Tuber magnatum TaxID=42249 RepID=A0A317SGL7_9PEZI|nr:Bystin-domain-containing protein [Tuber magnatum]
MPKEVAPRQGRRHNPLHDDLVENDGGNLRKIVRSKRKEKHEKLESYVDSGLSKRILKIARDQQDELHEEEVGKSAAQGEFFGSAAQMQLRDEEGESDEEEYEGADFGEDDIVEEVEVDEGDIELFNQFMPSGQGPEQRISLADKILEKIAEHEARLAGKIEGEQTSTLPSKIIEVYTKVGLLLSRYKSGKLPKAFKIIPSLKNWEEILFITRPDQWSPHACYEATRLFASTKANQCQKFLNVVLLDRVRDDIQEHKKLNVHLYNAIKKSLYKPAAFFKGFLFPLAQSGTCTLKEAQIVGSVLTRISVPVLHSAAALLRLCEMDYTGPTSVFIKVLIEKKYALPYKVIDALVFHYMRLKSSPDALPLLWHQSFLAFAQRYKNDITEDQRDVLLDVLLVKGHPLVSPEIRRELLEGRGRGVEVEEADDDLMLD